MENRYKSAATVEDKVKLLEEDVLIQHYEIQGMKKELVLYREDTNKRYTALDSKIDDGFKESGDLRSETREEINGKLNELAEKTIKSDHKVDLLKVEIKSLVGNTDKVIDKMDGRDKFIVNSAVGLVISVILIIIGVYIK